MRCLEARQPCRRFPRRSCRKETCRELQDREFTHQESGQHCDSKQRSGTMARPCRTRAWIKVFAFLFVAAAVAGSAVPMQNSDSKIADLRDEALAVPLQTPVRVDLYYHGGSI